LNDSPFSKLILTQLTFKCQFFNAENKHQKENSQKIPKASNKTGC